MPPLSSDDRIQFERAWVLTRLLALALCFGAPVMYAVVYLAAGMQAGLSEGLRRGIPWSHPAVLGSVILSAGILGTAILLGPLFQGRLRRDPTLFRAVAVSRQATVVSCALLESVAIFGLVAGILAGPGTAPLVFLLFLVPPVGYLVLVPGPQVWLAILEGATRG